MNILAYPNGFPINQPNPPFRFYAVFILLGGLTALFLSNYRAYKDGKEFNYFYTIFLIAFPCGILGARIWYYIASYSTEFINEPWYKIFYFWEGGLAIQGGAIGGVVIGILVAMLTKKDNPILRITDYCVPTILIAQAIGRWGNFFNQEVFGHAVSPQAWSFLPSFITYNMQNGTDNMLSGVKLPSGSIASPLFLIEGVMNIIFFFLIVYGYQAIARKRYLDGDQTILYFVAYGIIRLCLEPLRNSQFIMGVSSGSLQRSQYKSLIMAIVFISIGVVLLIANHLTVFLLKKNNKKSYLHSDKNFANLGLSHNKVKAIVVNNEDKVVEENLNNDDFFKKLQNKEEENKGDKDE